MPHEQFVPPSALSRPRFVEDTVYSEWVKEKPRGETPVVAATGTLGEKTIDHAPGIPWPQPSSDNDPISIELVRGHDGPNDDAWTVVVDGLRCNNLEKKENSHEVHCTLPPPFRTLQKRGVPEGAQPSYYTPSSETRVRPLAIGVRLENEARWPAQTQLVIEQVCRSSERRNQDPGALDEVIEIGRMDVVPYSVSDSVANATIVPYPFSAPAQSALGICSYREVELWKERVLAHEDQVAQIKKENNARYENYKKQATEIARDNFRAAVNNRRLAKGDPRASKKMKMRKVPKRPTERTVKALVRNSDPEKKGNGAKGRSHILGGQNESAPRCVVNVLKRLTTLCEDIKTEMKMSPPDVEKIGEVMSFHLHNSGETTVLAFLDGLTTGIPVNPALVDSVLEKEKATTNLEEANNELMQAEAVTKVADTKKATPKSNNGSQFVYDRIHITPRMSTVTFIRMRIETTEYDDTLPLSVHLRAEDYEAVAAHSVYAGHYKDVEDLHQAAQAFSESLGQPTQRSLVRSFTERVMLPGRGYKRDDKVKLNKGRVDDILKELRVIMSAILLPTWPPPDLVIMDDVPGVVRMADKNENGSINRVTTLGRVVAVRKLPQIVNPQRHKFPALRPPSDFAPPNEFEPDQLGSYGFASFTYGFQIAAGAALVTAGYPGWAILFATAPILTKAVGVITDNPLTNNPLARILSSLVKGAFVFVFPVTAATVGISMVFLETFLRTTKAVVSLPWRAATHIIESSRKAAELAAGEKKMRSSIYFRAAQKAKGTPVLSSLAAARAALASITSEAESLKSRINVHGDTGAIYDLSDGTRWRFSQRYTVWYHSLQEASRVKYDTDWTSSANSASMILLPPAEVIEQLYDAEMLRRIPISEVAARTAGKLSKNCSTSLAEIAAATAHRELVTAMREERFVLTGEFLGISTARSSLILAEQASRILDAAYGEKSGVTLVRGDDAIWSCLKGGAAARLAVRHLEIFERADHQRQHASNKPGEITGLIKAQVYGWRFTQRVFMSKFCKAWVTVAQSLVRQAEAPPKRAEVMATPQLIIRERAMQMAQMIARVSVLARENARAFAVISRFSPLLALDDQINDMVCAYLPEALRFANQKDEVVVPSPRNQKATWAARRMDPASQRDIVVGGGVDNMIHKLAGLEFTDASDTPQYTMPKPFHHYYCPQGARIDSAPGSTPFAVDSLGQVVVRLNYLKDAALQLRGSLKQGSLPDTSEHVLVGTMKEVTGQGPIWLARHPLVLTTRPGIVAAHFHTGKSRERPDTSYQNKHDTLVTMLQIQGDVQYRANIGAFVNALTSKARIVAYDTDRMVNALALAATQCGDGARNRVIRVYISDRLRLLSLSLALAVLHHNQPHFRYELVAHVQKGMDDAKRLLDHTLSSVGAALDKGCKRVSLAEACVSLV